MSMGRRSRRRLSGFARRRTRFCSGPWRAEVGDAAAERAAGARGVAAIRKHFGLFANLRPAVCFPKLTHASPIKESLIAGGLQCALRAGTHRGLYFGQPKGQHMENGEPVAVDTMVYRKSEIERIAHVAFKAAQGRNRRLTSIDKANVLENGVLWRKTVTRWRRSTPM